MLRIVGFAAAAAVLAAGAAAQPAPQVLPLDEESVVGGVEVACTGIAESRLEARWTRYPLRVEFANPRREYLAGATVAVKDAKGRQMLSVSCNGPWVLLRLPKGSYTVEAWMPGSAKPRTARVSPPVSGQKRVVLQFPDL